MIKSGQHALIIGKTGSGKSELLKNLALSSDCPVIIIDSKKDDAFFKLAKDKQKLLIAKSYEQAVKFLKRKYDFLIIRPSDYEISNPTALDNYLYLIYEKTKNVDIFIDELYQFHNGAGRCGKGLTALLTRGRSQNQSLIGCTQRPAFISHFLYSESTHFFLYRLNLESDKKTVRGFIPNLGKDYDIEKYFFYYYNSDSEELTKNEPIKPFKPKPKKSPFI